MWFVIPLFGERDVVDPTVLETVSTPFNQTWPLRVAASTHKSMVQANPSKHLRACPVTIANALYPQPLT